MSVTANADIWDTGVVGDRRAGLSETPQEPREVQALSPVSYYSSRGTDRMHECTGAVT